jgi:hypothetical protein
MSGSNNSTVLRMAATTFIEQEEKNSITAQLLDPLATHTQI